MEVRQAQFGNDVLEIAALLHRRARGKTTEHLCRSRVDQCIRRSMQRRQGFRAALVAVGGDTIRGFLYAEERNLFDLLPRMRVVEVAFLVGSHGAARPLLTRLRAMTKLRIHVQAVGLLVRPRAFSRLLRSLDPQAVAVVYEV